MRYIVLLKKKHWLYIAVSVFLFCLLCFPRTTTSVFYLSPDEIAKYIKKYEQQNDKPALKKLVNYYMLSEQNLSATIAFLEKYHSGNNDYRFYLSDMLLRRHNNTDVKEAMAILQELAFMDFPPAQSKLANLYAQGNYVEKNMTSALHWAKYFDCSQMSRYSEPYEFINIYEKQELGNKNNSFILAMLIYTRNHSRKYYDNSGYSKLEQTISMSLPSEEREYINQHYKDIINNGCEKLK